MWNFGSEWRKRERKREEHGSSPAKIKLKTLLPNLPRPTARLVLYVCVPLSISLSFLCFDPPKIQSYGRRGRTRIHIFAFTVASSIRIICVVQSRHGPCSLFRELQQSAIYNVAASLRTTSAVRSAPPLSKPPPLNPRSPAELRCSAR